MLAGTSFTERAKMRETYFGRRMPGTQGRHAKSTGKRGRLTRLFAQISFWSVRYRSCCIHPALASA